MTTQQSVACLKPGTTKTDHTVRGSGQEGFGLHGQGQPRGILLRGFKLCKPCRCLGVGVCCHWESLEDVWVRKVVAWRSEQALRPGN